MKITLFILYGILLFGLTIFSYMFVDQNFFFLKNLYLGFSTQNRAITTVLYTVIVTFFFLFYFLFLRLFLQKKLNTRDMNILIGVSVVGLLFSYPAILSYDIFNYVTTAKLTFFHHENPYVVMPIEIINEPFLSFTRAANKLALYGPFWIALTGVPYIFGFGNFMVTLFNFKLLVVLFYLGTLFLIWKISRNTLAVYAFGLNPLVLIETIVSNHNDIVMVFLVLFAFFCAIKKRIFLSILFFAFSILIKYATLFLTPVFLYMVIKIIRKEKIDWPFIFYSSFFTMLLIFFLSSFREEIYPWYAIWFLSFFSLIPIRRIFFQVNAIFSFSLLLRYTPYIFLGTYLFPTPLIRNIVSFVPLFLFTVYYVYRKKI